MARTRLFKICGSLRGTRELFLQVRHVIRSDLPASATPYPYRCIALGLVERLAFVRPFNMKYSGFQGRPVADDHDFLVSDVGDLDLRLAFLEVGDIFRFG